MIAAAAQAAGPWCSPLLGGLAAAPTSAESCSRHHKIINTIIT
jgi:hypothetical protein